MHVPSTRTSFCKSAKSHPAPLKKSELRREAILRHALTIFDKQCFANTSLDDIAKVTGIKREAIYYYFKNRAEILLALIRPQSETLVTGIRKILNSDLSAPEKLHAAIQNHLERFDRHCLEMTVALRDIYLDDARGVRKEMDKTWRTYETIWTKIIESGQKSGEFVMCGDPKMIAFAILGMCNWLARWYDPGKSISINQLIATYFSIVSKGLIARKGSYPPAASQRSAASTSLKAPKKSNGRQARQSRAGGVTSKKTSAKKIKS
jgi:AcrR family transcriptional regulator